MVKCIEVKSQGFVLSKSEAKKKKILLFGVNVFKINFKML